MGGNPSSRKISALVATLTEGSSEAKEKAAGALSNLAADAENRIAIAKAGAIPALVALLAGGSNEAQTEAASALANLAAANAENKIAIEKAGAIPALVALLAGGSNEAQTNAAGALRNLAAANAENKIAIEKAGAIPALVALLAGGSNEAQTEAAGALRNLAAANAENKIAIEKAGAIPALVALLAGGSNEAQTQAAGALANLADANAENKIAIEKAGAIPALVALLAGGSNEAQTNAAVALRNLAAANAENKIAIEKAGGIPALVALCKSESIESRVVAVSTLIFMGTSASIISSALSLDAHPQRRSKNSNMLGRALQDIDHFVLSTKFTKERNCNPSGECAQDVLGARRTYNPNLFDKSQNPRCGTTDGSCMGKCTPYGIGETPADDDCWAASYRWHLTKHSTRARSRGGRLPIMLRIIEDGTLGAGQIVEKQMAEELQIEVVELEWSGFDFSGTASMNFKEAMQMVMRQQLELKLGCL